MKIDCDLIREKVNNYALEVVTFLTKYKYMNTPMFFGGIGHDGLPTVVCVLNEYAKEYLDDIEEMYTGYLERCYDNDGEDFHESHPEYEGISFVVEEDFDERLYTDKVCYGFYIINGTCYDSCYDVV